MFKNIWNSCLRKNYRQINEYEEPNSTNIELTKNKKKRKKDIWQDINNLDCVEENELFNEEFILERRIKNMCRRWNISRVNAYILIMNVDRIQNSNQKTHLIKIESDSENENESENLVENQVNNENEENYC